MKTIKGPAVFLAQFYQENEPFNSLKSLCKWAKDLGFKAIQIPTWNTKIFDLEKVSKDKTFANDIKAIVENEGVEISELSTHLQGQLVAVHPAYDVLFDAFAPDKVKGNPIKRTEWAIEQVKMAAKASSNLGLKAHATFSGSLLWPYMYPWPQRTQGLIKTGFQELGKRWIPILDEFKNNDVALCYEIHPGEDIFDGITFEMFLEATQNHPSVNILYDPSHFMLQQLDYIQFIDIYHQKIKMFHVKDAEFNPNGKQGVYGSYSDWVDRAGRFRSLGDGHVDFGSIFSKLTQYNYTGWAVLEWECCLKNSDDGAKEGAEFINNHIIKVTERSFDDFAKAKDDLNLNKKILGIS